MNVNIYDRSLASETPYLAANQLSIKVKRLTWKAIGGCDQAKLEARGNNVQIWGLLSALRCPVLIMDDSADAVWWGYIEDVKVKDKSVSVGASLEKMANRVRCVYSEVNTAGTVGDRAETAWVENTDSQTEYGIKEQQVNLSEGTAAQALAKANMALEAKGTPLGTVNFGDFREVVAEVTCAGWWKSLDWQLYNQPAGKEAYEDEGDGLQAFGDSATRAKLAQSFQIASAISWSAATVRFRMRKEGTPTDTVTVSLCSDSGGNPGTVLVSGTLTGAEIDENLNWVEFQMSARQALALSTTYWITIERSGAASGANYFKCDGNEALGYTRGAMKIYNGSSWVARSPDADMLFGVAGTEETNSQLDTMITAEGQFIVDVNSDVSSGIYSSPYREGDRTALECAEELLDTGTSNNRRMLAEVKKDRRLRLWEEPAKAAADHYLKSNGKLYNEYGQELDPYHYPVGVWVELVDIAPVTTNLSELSGLQSLFIEEVVVDDKGKASLKARDESKLTELE